VVGVEMHIFLKRRQLIEGRQRNRQAVSHPTDVDDDLGRRFGCEYAAQMRYHKRGVT
jgi:hypothetical protein